MPKKISAQTVTKNSTKRDKIQPGNLPLEIAPRPRGRPPLYNPLLCETVISCYAGWLSCCHDVGLWDW